MFSSATTPKPLDIRAVLRTMAKYGFLVFVICSFGGVFGTFLGAGLFGWAAEATGTDGGFFYWVVMIAVALFSYLSFGFVTFVSLFVVAIFGWVIFYLVAASMRKPSTAKNNDEPIERYNEPPVHP